MEFNKDLMREFSNFKAEGYSLQEIENLMGLTGRQVRYASELWHNKRRAAGIEPINPDSKEAQETMNTLHQDGSVLSRKIRAVEDGDDLKPEELLALHGFDPKKWILTSGTSNVWGKDKNDEPLFQSKIHVKPVGVSLDDILDTVNDKVKPLDDVDDYEYHHSSHSLIIPLFDMHFGVTTLDSVEPYFIELEGLIQSTNYDNIEILIGGDYFHSDFMKKAQTARNTQLDHVDEVKALNDGTKFISALLTVSNQNADNVEVRYMRGNHDSDKSYVWAYGMKLRYSGTKIKWHLTLDTRDCFELGHVGVMFSHGDKPRQSKLPQLFATEYKDIWADSNQRLIFVGHYHKEKVDDDRGCELIQVPTMKPSDNYERDNGYTMSRRKMAVYEVDDTHLTSVHYIEPQPDDPLHQLDGLVAY